MQFRSSRRVQAFNSARSKEVLVISMRTDPEPDYVFSFKSSKNAIAYPDAGRVNAIAMVQFLEVESRMAWMTSRNQFVETASFSSTMFLDRITSKLKQANGHILKSL